MSVLHGRDLVRGWATALVIPTLLCGCYANTAVAGQAKSTSGIGTLVISVQKLPGVTVGDITVYVRDRGGRVDSSVTDSTGIVRFERVVAGPVFVRTVDKDWLKRPKGAFLGRRDTVIVRARVTTRHVALVAQRIPPALYR